MWRICSGACLLWSYRASCGDSDTSAADNKFNMYYYNITTTETRTHHPTSNPTPKAYMQEKVHTHIYRRAGNLDGAGPTPTSRTGHREKDAMEAVADH